MDTSDFARIVSAVQNALGAEAQVVGAVGVEGAHFSYPGAIVAIERPHMWSTHLVVLPPISEPGPWVSEPGARDHLQHGHYDIPSYNEALKDLHERALRGR